jgi:hypothetical protein
MGRAMSAPQLAHKLVERFARDLARSLLLELALAAPITSAEAVDALRTCRICARELRAHERPERTCDSCLRAYQTRPRAA